MLLAACKFDTFYRVTLPLLNDIDLDFSQHLSKLTAACVPSAHVSNSAIVCKVRGNDACACRMA